jgi:hypothetical protein
MMRPERSELPTFCSQPGNYKVNGSPIIPSLVFQIPPYSGSEKSFDFVMSYAVDFAKMPYIEASES